MLRTRNLVLLALALVPLLALLLATMTSVLAHTVETVEGKTYEGRILIDDDEKVVIATTFAGEVTVPRAQVKKVDDVTPPLRDQLKFRADRAKDDVKRLWDLHKWAKQKGFEEDLPHILERIVELDAKSSRAHKMLGHEKVDGVWMTPEAKAIHLEEKHAEEMRAKGLVPYEGRWVTPEEKEGLEKGLMKDGDDWVTEEEYHRRRGEVLVDGEWIRIGEKEGKAWQQDLTGARVRTKYLWSPNYDVYYDVKEEHAKRALEGAEKAFVVFRKTLKPTAGTWPVNQQARLRLHLLNKLPAYARFAEFFDKKEECSDLVKGWLPAVRRQHSFWWVDPIGIVGVYKFPNTPRTFISNAVHNAGLIILTRYRFNYRFPAQWMLDGFAYYLEMESIGYSDTFSLSRQGTGAAAAGGKPIWADSEKWRGALKSLVAEGRDPPIKRISRMNQDQMGYVELVKSWSVIECLIRFDRDKFEAFIAADKDRGKTTEDALKEVYGWDWRKLDHKWRAYVKAGFRHGAGAPPGGAPAE